MENKYYTPSIEEFRVGFEFYMPLLKEDKEGNLYREDYVLHTWSEEDNMESNFNVDYEGDKKTVSVPNVCKVKYLDREDIESLGFESVIPGNLEGAERDSYEPNWWVMNMYGKGWQISKDTTKDNIYSITYGQHEYIDRGRGNFEGTIKNKSELAWLLKQLGI